MDRAILDRAIKNYGERQQCIKAIEELSELSQALARYVNKLPSNVPEEIADVEIMLEQVKVITGTPQAKIDDMKRFKLDRLSIRMDAEEAVGITQANKEAERRWTT